MNDVAKPGGSSAELAADPRASRPGVDEFGTVRNLADRLLTIPDLSTALEEVLDGAIALFEADRGTLQVHDPRDGALRHAAARGFESDALARIPPPDRDFHSTCAVARRTGERVIASDIAEDPRWADHAQTAASLGYRGAISFPMKTRGDELQGVLTVHFREPRTPTEQQLTSAELLARLAAHLIERARSEEALREIEERYRDLFDSIDEGFCIIEVLFDDEDEPVDYRFLQINPAFEGQTGLVDAVGRTIKEMVAGHERHWFETYGRIARTGTPERFEDAAAALNRWYDVYAFRVGKPGENKVGILFRDVQERKRVEEVLRDAQERQEYLLGLSDALNSLGDPASIKNAAARLLGERLGVNRVFYADAEDKHWIVPGAYERDVSPLPNHPFAMAQFGSWMIDAFRSGRRLVVENMAEDARFSASEKGAHFDLSIGSQVVLPLVKEGQLVAILVAQAVGPRQWSKQELGLIQETAERTWAAVEQTRAEAALRDSERHQGLLLAELQHRVRNTLAVIRSIAGRTADRSENVEELFSHFEGRLNAFARVQSAVTRSSAGSVDFRAIVDDELLAVASHEGQGLRIRGPNVCLTAKAAESLSRAIHELATNAVKYGALSNEGGRLTIDWAVTPVEGDGRALAMEWVETGLREPPNPTHEGFGHELLRRTLPYDLGAETNIDFTSDGMLFKLRMPLGPDVLAE